MIVGKCPRCGTTYSGSSLASLSFQLCSRCGVDIDIWNDDDGVFLVHSSYKPEEEKIKQALIMDSPRDSQKEPPKN